MPTHVSNQAHRFETIALAVKNLILPVTLYAAASGTENLDYGVRHKFALEKLLRISRTAWTLPSGLTDHQQNFENDDQQQLRW